MNRAWVALLITILAGSALAENVTISAPVLVNVTCGMEQCIITGPGLTSFYPNTNSSQSYNLSVPFSYQNVTVQTVTVVQNTSNVTVITQVVNVTQCEAGNL